MNTSESNWAGHFKHDHNILPPSDKNDNADYSQLKLSQMQTSSKASKIKFYKHEIKKLTVGTTTFIAKI